MLRPDCSARLAALQLLQSVPCDLWTNRSHRRGVGGISLGITLKTHTDHHIAHNNKTLNNTQKSSSISCSTEQIFSMPFYFSIAFICKLDFIFQRSKPILNQIFAFSLQVFVFLEVLRTISDSICYSDDIPGFCWREDGALTGRRSRGADIPGQQWGHHLEIVTADES